MEENKMKEVAKLLGIEIGKEFYIKGYSSSTFILDNLGLLNVQDREYYSSILVKLLTGKLEIDVLILKPEEKTYLENVLNPFKDRVKCLYKVNRIDECGRTIHSIIAQVGSKDNYSNDCIRLPRFEPNEMYEKMELNHMYTLKELGLFQ